MLPTPLLVVRTKSCLMRAALLVQLKLLMRRSEIKLLVHAEDAGLFRGAVMLMSAETLGLAENTYGELEKLGK